MREVAEAFVDQRRIVDIANGVDTTLFEHATREPDSDHLMAVRRLVPKNGVQYLIEAMPAILEQRSHVRLTVVGDGFLRPALERRVRELGLSSAVEFRGAVPHECLPEVLATASHVVFASSAEGFSLAALEAMSVGRPVIASAVGGFPAMLGANERGFLVSIFERSDSDYGAPEQLSLPGRDALVSGILDALRNPEASARVAQAGASWVRANYDWSVIARQVADVYEGIVSQ
jgi:glycosyltransferase involved in cell wall biosynthesis